MRARCGRFSDFSWAGTGESLLPVASVGQAKDCDLASPEGMLSSCDEGVEGGGKGESENTSDCGVDGLELLGYGVRGSVLALSTKELVGELREGVFTEEGLSESE